METLNPLQLFAIALAFAYVLGLWWMVKTRNK
jgi:hypothetical protein